MLLARYFTNVTVQQKLCTHEGYERVTTTLPKTRTGVEQGENAIAFFLFAGIFTGTPPLV
jgi:hypothetical protein